jgi:mono/diheme cytochrome c family protein
MRWTIAALLIVCASSARAQDIAQGRYQAVLGDCQGCHTAKNGAGKDGAPFAGGVVLDTPFGQITAPNITPDKTGIGGWSLADFKRALREGIAPKGKRLYPAMPYPSYARMSDGDVAALWAYLRTVKPVQNQVESNRLRFPFNVRALMAGWDWLYLKNARFTPSPGKSPQWNRGAYIITGPGHCGTCHTPKQLLGADRADALTGGSLEGWFAPEITDASPQGLGDWSVADIVTYLKTGWSGHAVASGPMAEVVERSTSQMMDSDLEAVALYLKDQPAAQQTRTVVAAEDKAVTAGRVLYQNNCVACHGWDGKGERLIFPPLAGNAVLMQQSPENLIRVVLEGAQAVSTKSAPTTPSMPSFAWKFDDGEVAQILTYVRNSWGNQGGAVSAGQVAKARAGLKSGS